MLMRRQDLSVLGLYCLGVPQLRAALLQRGGSPLTTFVTFHDVGPDSAPGFAAHLAFLQRIMHVASLEDFLDGRLCPDRINAVITFDDGYQGWITHALPALRRLGVPATFFVASGCVGLSRPDTASFMRTRLRLDEAAARTEPGLSVDDVRRLVDAGHSVGGHTVNHVDLTAIDDEACIQREIEHDKHVLEHWTGAPVRCFAYPFGAWRHPRLALADLVRRAGYGAAVTTRDGFNGPLTPRFLLRRELTPAGIPHWVFRARACGAYALVRRLKAQWSRGGDPLEGELRAGDVPPGEARCH
jgi:peptidoglycan/xylan/chitin deacetylase (PgdA/CDA1 family)